MFGNRVDQTNPKQVEITIDAGETRQDNKLTQAKFGSLNLSNPISIRISAVINKVTRDWRRNIIRGINFQSKNVQTVKIDGNDYRITANLVVNFSPINVRNAEEEFKKRVIKSLGIKLPQ